MPGAIHFIQYIHCLFPDIQRYVWKGTYEEMRYNLTPFLEIKRFVKYRSYMTTTSVMLNLVGNVLAFVPFGMLIRWVRGKKTGFFTATLAAFAFSLSIELVQLITKL